MEQERQEFSEQVIKKINKVLDIAYKHNGKLFGGYLRDVIIPRMKDPSCKVLFKDVDIWFTDEYKACDFIEAISKKYDFKHYPRITIGDDYPFTRQQYHLYKDGKCLAWFDVVISKEFPVDDFDVNFLSYYNSSFTSHHKSITVTQLVDNIYRKEMTITEEYYQKVTKSSYPDKCKSMHYATRIHNRYLQNGWTIIHNDKMLKLEMIKGVEGTKQRNAAIFCFDVLFRKWAQPLNEKGGLCGLTSTAPRTMEEVCTPVKIDLCCAGSNDVKSIKSKEQLIIELAESADEFRKAAKKWNDKLIECATGINFTDKNYLEKYTVRVDEPSFIEKLLLAKK